MGAARAMSSTIRAWAASAVIPSSGFPALSPTVRAPRASATSTRCSISATCSAFPASSGWTSSDGQPTAQTASPAWRVRRRTSSTPAASSTSVPE